MFSKDEATEERIAAYLAALEEEASQYEAGLAAAQAGGDEPRVAKLDRRLKGVKDEIARVKKVKPKGSK